MEAGVHVFMEADAPSQVQMCHKCQYRTKIGTVLTRFVHN